MDNSKSACEIANLAPGSQAHLMKFRELKTRGAEYQLGLEKYKEFLRYHADRGTLFREMGEALGISKWAARHGVYLHVWKNGEKRRNKGATHCTVRKISLPYIPPPRS